MKRISLLLILLLCLSTAKAYEWEDENGTIWNFTTSGENATISSVSGNVPNDLIIPNVVYVNDNAYNVTSFTSPTFKYNRSLTSITIPEGVTTIPNGAFQNCGSLTSINIPEGVTSISDNAFKDCSNLQSVELPQSVSYIGDEAFANCSNLTSINIPEGATVSESAFNGCDNLNNNDDNEYTWEDDNGTVWVFSLVDDGAKIIRVEGSEVEDMYIPDEVTYNGEDGAEYINVVEIPSFSGFDYLVSIVIPEGVTSINDYTFKDCSNLQSVWLPQSVSYIGDEAFANCSNLTSIYIPEGAFIAESAFYACDNLNYDGDGYTWKDENGSIWIFYGFDNLNYDGDGYSWDDENGTFWTFSISDGKASITTNAYYAAISGNIPSDLNIPNVVYVDGFPFDVTSIGKRALMNCSSLTSVIIPESVTSIGNSAFSGCSSLTSVIIPESVTSIGNSAFYGCSSLTSLTIPGSVTSIENYAFSGCSSLSKIVIPNIQSWFAISFGRNYSNPMNVGPSKHIYSDETTEITELVIPEGVITIPDYAFRNCSSLTSVTIPEGVTSIGGSAFNGCSSLTSVTIPEGVTSIGGSAFNGCSSLTSVTIPDGVTSIENSAFSGCSSLTSVTIPEGVTSIGGSAFNGCSSLTSVTIPDGVTSIENSAFSGCSSFTSVTIPEGVTSIGGFAFNGCSSLTSVTIPEGVTSIGYSAFSGCSSLTSVTIPEGVTFIDNSAFSGCSSLTSVTIPEGVTFISANAFKDCSNLQSVELPQSVSYIGDEAFANCSNLTSINIPEGATVSESAFYGCDNLNNNDDNEYTWEDGNGTVWVFSLVDNGAKIIRVEGTEVSDMCIPSVITFTYNGEDGAEDIEVNVVEIPSFSGFDYLVSIVIPEGVTSINDYTFKDCSNLQSVELPQSVSYIGDEAFANCSNLTSINIPEGATVSESAFYGCDNLNYNPDNHNYDGDGYTWEDENGTIWTFSISDGKASITTKGWYKAISGNIPSDLNIPNVVYVDEHPFDVTSIGDNAFYDCWGINSISIPDGVTSIGPFAFSECGLSSITIPESVTSIGYSAFYCSPISSITIPGSVTSIGGSAFDNSGLTSITISEGVSSIGFMAFYWTGLTSIIIPGSVSSIDWGAFLDCHNLTSITISEGVSSIGDIAFKNCVNLISITFPSSITSLGGNMFYGCTKLESIICESPTPCPQPEGLPSSIIIYVPNDAVDAYKEAWPDYQFMIASQSTDSWIAVEVTAKTSTSNLAEQIGENNLQQVTKLKLSGTINSYDMMIIRNKMVNLRELDMEDVDIVTNYYQYYPEFYSEDHVLGGMFLNNKNIKSVILPKHIERIGYQAFANCPYLETIQFTGNDLKVIDDCAFTCCTKIETVVIPEGVESIGGAAFRDCYNLQSVTLPQSLLSLGDAAFSGCRFAEVNIPANITELPSNLFASCGSLQNVKLSPKTSIIGNGAFNNCVNLSEFYLPPYLEDIGDGAFSGCSNLKDIYAYMVDVPAISTNTFDDYQHKNLYVPEFLYNSYYYDTNWSQFLSVNICDLKPGDYEAFYANRDVYFEPGVERITADTPEVELGEHGGIIVVGEEQHFGDVHQTLNHNSSSASLIADGEDDGSNNNMPINNLFVEIQVQANRWYFFCFPFDVTIADCDYPGRYVWRHYDGAIRALLGSGGWQPVEGSKLEARKGYIFQSNAAGTLTVKFDRPTFGGNRPCDLAVYATDNAANASWNFVGNPYSCYYDFQEEDFTSPITVWNGTSYVAYRPGDDEYHLQPYEAFFVQKPEAQDQINFETDRRETYQQIQNNAANSVKARQAKGINPDRLILNLTIGGMDSEAADRTRVVLNEKASRSYELECDAAKFISSDAIAQIYSVEGDNSMSINERPMEGDIRIGYVAKTAGTFRISAPRMDIPMILVDTKTNTSFDLSIGDYEFQSEAGINNSRFLLKSSGESTEIRNLTKQTGVAVGLQEGGLSIGGADGQNVMVYTTGGALTAQHAGNGFVALPRGSYIVRVANASAKVYVK